MHEPQRPQRATDQLARAWGVETGPSRGPRPKLQIDQIADVAVALADGGGLEAVTLARVAARCGVVTTALYRYVAAKADLADLMSEHALGEPPQLDPAARDAVEAWVDAFAGQLREHPWLAVVQPRGMPLAPRALGWLDLLVRSLTARGCSDVPGLALQLSTTVRAYCAMEFSLVDTPAPPDWWPERVASRFPHLAQAFAGRDVGSPADDLPAALARILAGDLRPEGKPPAAAVR